MHKPLLIGFAGLVVLLVSCSTNKDGSPTATSTTSESRMTDPTSESKPLASLDSCTLLDKALDGRDFPDGERVDISSENGCQTNKPQVASYSLNLISGATLSQWADADNAHKGSINERSAIQEPSEETAGCAVAMKISSDAIASVGVSRSNGSTDKACDLVTEVAETIEPMLPGGNGEG